MKKSVIVERIVMIPAAAAETDDPNDRTAAAESWSAEYDRSRVVNNYVSENE